VSGSHSGRRPELHDEARETRDGENVPRREELPAGNGPGRTGAREDPVRVMKSQNANVPVPAQEGRCQSCGEEILPVPT
jgi:hypothetical protein